MCWKYFRCHCFGGEPSEFRLVGNLTRQGGMTSGILFKFHINEVLDTIMKLPVGCSLNYSKVNIVCYADVVALLAPTAHALQVMLDTLSDTKRNLLLKNNVQK